jgi:hypothetical protein
MQGTGIAGSSQHKVLHAQTKNAQYDLVAAAEGALQTPSQAPVSVLRTHKNLDAK